MRARQFPFAGGDRGIEAAGCLLRRLLARRGLRSRRGLGVLALAGRQGQARDQGDPQGHSASSIVRSTEPVVIGWYPGRACSKTSFASASPSGVCTSAS